MLAERRNNDKRCATGHCAGSRTRRDKPSKCHSWDNHYEQTLRVSSHVSSGQLFYAYGKKTNSKHDPHDLPCESICDARPRTRIENSHDMRSYKNAKDCSEGNFICVKLSIAINDWDRPKRYLCI